MALKSPYFAFATILAAILLVFASEVRTASLDLHLPNAGRDLYAGKPFNVGLRSFDKRDVGDALSMKRIGATVALTPRICPPSGHSVGGGGLATRCIGSRKREETTDPSVLLYHGGFSSDTVESEYQTLTLTVPVPSDIERGWSLLSATLFYLMGPELIPVLETVNATVLIG